MSGSDGDAASACAIEASTTVVTITKRKICFISLIGK